MRAQHKTQLLSALYCCVTHVYRKSCPPYSGTPLWPELLIGKQVSSRGNNLRSYSSTSGVGEEGWAALRNIAAGRPARGRQLPRGAASFAQQRSSQAP